MYEVTTDLPVISAHHGDLAPASWLAGKCSTCGSITPDAFVGQIHEGQTCARWEWVGDMPLYCETAIGRFYADHLLDRGAAWLHAWQGEIALATGVVFYWDRDFMRSRTFVDHGVAGGALMPDVVDRITAFLEEIDRA